MADNMIDVDVVLDAFRKRQQVNSINIMDVVFMREGNILEVPWARRAKFRFTGLSIDYFVRSYFGESEEPSDD